MAFDSATNDEQLSWAETSQRHTSFKTKNKKSAPVPKIRKNADTHNT